MYFFYTSNPIKSTDSKLSVVPKRHLGKLNLLQLVQNQDIMTWSRSSFLIWQNKPNQIDRRNLAKQTKHLLIGGTWQNKPGQEPLTSHSCQFLDRIRIQAKAAPPLLLMHYWHLHAHAQPEQIQNRDRCGIVGTGIHL